MFIPDHEIKYGEPDPAKMCVDGTSEEFERAPASPYLRALYVKFVNGAHTKWHYYTGEQMLVATQRKGFVEFQGLLSLEIREGDRVFIPTGLWHWHGAVEGEALVHLAVTTSETIWDKTDPCQKHAHSEDLFWLLGLSVPKTSVPVMAPSLISTFYNV
jgi:quercetin dioxygenase-like cupin family protein